jgi:hypothetical protein
MHPDPTIRTDVSLQQEMVATDVTTASEETSLAALGLLLLDLYRFLLQLCPI